MMTNEPSISSSRDRNACCCCSGLSGSPYIMPACAPLPVSGRLCGSGRVVGKETGANGCARGCGARRLGRARGPALAARCERGRARTACGEAKDGGNDAETKASPRGRAPRRIRQLGVSHARASVAASGRRERGAPGRKRGAQAAVKPGAHRLATHLHGRPLARRARRNRHAVHRVLARVLAVAAAAVERHHLAVRRRQKAGH
jgi:hypothetical protein